MTSILKQINSALLDLDQLRHQSVNKEAYRYRKLISAVYGKIIQHVSSLNRDRKHEGIIDKELRNYVLSCIPSSVKKKMRLTEKEEFAIVATRGSSFIEEFSLRPENHLLWLVESVERWDDDGLDFVIEQLARNKFVDQDAIDRIKKWDVPARKISSYYWQKLVDKLDDLPKIREKCRRERKTSFSQVISNVFWGLMKEEALL